MQVLRRWTRTKQHEPYNFLKRYFCSSLNIDEWRNKFFSSNPLSHVTIITNKEQAQKAVQIIRENSNRVFAIDTETTGVCERTPIEEGTIVCWTLYGGDDIDFGNGPHLYINNIGKSRETLAVFKPVLEDKSIRKVFHNYAYDYHMFHRHNINIQGFFSDTWHLARLYDSSLGGWEGHALKRINYEEEISTGYSLKNLTKRYIRNDFPIGLQSYMKSDSYKAMIQRLGKTTEVLDTGHKERPSEEAPCELNLPDSSSPKDFPIESSMVAHSSPYLHLDNEDDMKTWIAYAAIDAWSTHRLFEFLWDAVQKEKWECFLADMLGETVKEEELKQLSPQEKIHFSRTTSANMNNGAPSFGTSSVQGSYLPLSAYAYLFMKQLGDCLVNCERNGVYIAKTQMQNARDTIQNKCTENENTFLEWYRNRPLWTSGNLLDFAKENEKDNIVKSLATASYSSDHSWRGLDVTTLQDDILALIPTPKPAKKKKVTRTEESTLLKQVAVESSAQLLEDEATDPPLMLDSRALANVSAETFNLGSVSHIRSLIFGGGENDKQVYPAVTLYSVRHPYYDEQQEKIKELYSYIESLLKYPPDPDSPAASLLSKPLPLSRLQKIKSNVLAKIIPKKIACTEYHRIIGLGIPEPISDSKKTTQGLASVSHELLLKLLQPVPNLESPDKLDSQGFTFRGEAFTHLALKKQQGKEGALEICKAIYHLSMASKLRRQATNATSLVEFLSSKSRIHPSLLPDTATGRLACRRPNLQNQPNSANDEFEIRECFTASPGKVLIVADFDQLELRVLAHMANISSMIKTFTQNTDLHGQTAIEMFPEIRERVEKGEIRLKDIKSLYPRERNVAKIINFSVAYGSGPRSISERTGIGESEAKMFLLQWKNSRVEFGPYEQKIGKEARNKRRVYSVLGRPRRLPLVRESTGGLSSHSYRSALNHTIQGSAADICGSAMIMLNRCEILKTLGFKLILQVHDECILEGPRECVERAKKRVEYIMEHSFGEYSKCLKVPFPVDCKIGLTWGEAKGGGGENDWGAQKKFPYDSSNAKYGNDNIPPEDTIESLEHCQVFNREKIKEYLERRDFDVAANSVLRKV